MLVDGVSSLTPAKHDQIRHKIGAERLHLVESSITLRWIPLADHLGVLKALYAALGQQEYEDYFVRCLRGTLDSPNLFAKAAGAAILWRGSPFAFVDQLPLSGRFVFKNLGEIGVDKVSDGERLVWQRDSPAELLQSEEWCRGWRASLQAMVEHAAGDRTVNVEITRREHLRGVLEVSCRASTKRTV